MAHRTCPSQSRYSFCWHTLGLGLSLHPLIIELLPRRRQITTIISHCHPTYHTTPTPCLHTSDRRIRMTIVVHYHCRHHHAHLKIKNEFMFMKLNRPVCPDLELELTSLFVRSLSTSSA